MPKKRRGRGAAPDTEVATAVGRIQVLDRLPDNPHRPRTRAWVKQEESKNIVAVDPSSTSVLHLSPSQKGLQLPRRYTRADSPSRDTSPKITGIAARSKVKGGLPKDNTTRSRPSGGPSQLPKTTTTRSQNQSASLNRLIDPATENRTVSKKGVETRQQPDLTSHRHLTRKDETSKSKQSALTSWLGELESPTGQLATRIPSTLPESDDTMDSSSTSNRESIRESGENESTAKATGSKRVRVSDDKLRHRRINRKATADRMLHHLKSILKTELPERHLEDMEDLKSILERFLQQIKENPKKNCWPYIDDFSYDFDESKSKINYPVVNRKYFEADMSRCLTGNEAVLQRTIMMNIINKYWLGEIFDWNSEGQWSQPKETRLPSRLDGDEISLPKPDLTISFNLESFTGYLDDSAPIQHDLKKCLSPDGGGRCFPFLFMEVKKAGADLQEAYMANLHSASQALYNMYIWMVRAGQEQEFMETVRVFSVVFNAQDLSVRVHRAEELDTTNRDLQFHFDEFAPLARYTKDQACLLIRTILSDYAAPELHPTLQKAFDEIVTQEDELVASKRKASAVRSPSTKRSRRGQSTGQSFNMANLTT